MDGVSGKLRQRRASLPVLPSMPPNPYIRSGGRGTIKSRIMKFISKSKSDITVVENGPIRLKAENQRKSFSVSNLHFDGLLQTDEKAMDVHEMNECAFSPSTELETDIPNDYNSFPVRSQFHRLSVRSIFSSFKIPEIRVNNSTIPSNKFSDQKPMKRLKLRRPSLPVNALSKLNLNQHVVKSKSSDDILSKGLESNKVTVNVILPSGFSREVTVNNDVIIRDIVEEATMDTNVESYRVLLASTRAILDLQAEANLLGNFGEIVVDEDDVFDEIDGDDPRLRIAKNLYRTERYYQDDIRSVFDVYAEPLRKFSSLSRTDHQRLFVGIEPILSLSAMVCIKLEDCIKLWDPGSTKIGSLFSKQFWFHYEEYCSKFSEIRDLLQDKRENDQEFVQFCQMRQGAGKYSLDALLLRPVQRIPNYEHYLSSLLAETDAAHPDYDDLNKAYSKVHTMVRERQGEICIVENEHKMESVQHRFPNDDLQLQEQKTMKKALQNRRKSAPGGLLLKSLKVKHNSSSDLTKSPPMIPDQALASRASLTHSPNRLYILEGPVQLTTGLQSQDRYLFLFNDLLLIAKQKSSRTFKLKDRIRVCEIWTADCLDEVCEATRTPETSFVVGWPTASYVATFEDAETKEAWFTKLKENITIEKEKEQPKSIVLKIVNKDMENTSSSKSMTVGNYEDADEIVKRCMEQFHITKGESKDYQLWVISGKEESPYPLIGHEHPYSIKMSHVRDSLKGDGSETPVIVDKDLNDNSINCQFILRETKKVPTKVNIDENQRKKSKVKKSPLSFWKKRHRDPSPSAAPTGKLFGHPLAQVFTDDNELPKPIYAMLHYLFVHGPFTSGIFRKPANSKCVRDLREKLDATDDYTIDEINPLVVASTLKEYLRSLPDCLLLRELYSMWLETMEMDNANEMIKALQHVFMRLPQKNSIVLRHLMCLLYHINKRAEENSMTAYNLAVCISQSLLWINITDSVDLVQQSEAMEKVPKLIQFMVDHCIEVFGEDTITLFGDPVIAKQRGDSSTDSDSMNSLLTNGQCKRDDSSIDSLEHFIDIDSSPGARKSHLSPTNLSRDSGLCSSDNQLNDFSEDYHETDISQNSTKPRITRTLSHEPDKHQKGRNVNPLSHSYDSEMDSVTRIDGVLGHPKAPPRNKKKSESPISDLTYQKNAIRMPTVYSDVELRMHHVSSDQSLIRRPAGRGMPKRSTDSALGSSIGSSLGSVEESSEASHDELLDFQSKRKDLGTLQKSESGATLYLQNDSLLNQGGFAEIYKHSSALNHDSIEEEMNYGKPAAFHSSIKRNNSGKSSHLLDNQPPNTRHSWDGMLDNRKKHPVLKTTTKVTSLKTKSNFSLSPHESLDEETEDEVRKSLYDDVPPVSNTSTHTENTPVQIVKSTVKVNDPIQSTPVSRRAPPLKNLKSQSLDSYEQTHVQYHHQTQQVPVLEKSSSSDMSRIKRSPRDVDRGQLTRHLKGMTSKGSDLFPTQVRRGLVQSPLSSASSEQLQVASTHANKASMHCSSSPRSKSSPRTDYEEHMPKATRMVRQAALKNEKGLERSSSDTRVAQQFLGVQKDLTRPIHPPPYQEAIMRKNMCKPKPVVVSDDQVVKQREASARARKLYEESQKRYSEEQKQKEYAYFSEPEAVAQSRENTPVRDNKSKDMKQPPSYEMACKRSEELKEQRRSQQGYPPNYHDRMFYSKDNIPVRKYSNNTREGASVYTDGDRERTPTPREGSSVKANDGKRRSKSRERREGQRLSDTRLENNRRKKKGASLSRSKSDSSEHLNKVYKLRAQDSTDSEDEWPLVHRTRRISKSASKERLQNFDIHKRPKSADAATLLRQLQETGLDIIDPGYHGNSVHNRHTLRRNTTVKNKGWHKELAEKYDGKKGMVFYQPEDLQRSEPKLIISYNNHVSHESEEHLNDEERPKRRWMPPPHPTKDLVIIRKNEKDGCLTRSSSNVITNKKSKPFLTREMRANTLTHIDSIPNDMESSTEHVPMHTSNRIHIDSIGQHNSNNHSSRNNSSHHHLHDYQYRHSDSPVSTNSEREDSDNEEQRGLTWSVSKLRAKYDNPSPNSSSNKLISNNSANRSVNSHPPHFYSPNSQPPNTLRSSRDHLSSSPALASQTVVSRGSLQQKQQRVSRVYGSDVSNPNAAEHYI